MTQAAISDSAGLAEALRRLAGGSSLSAAETTTAFGVVMRGGATPEQIASLLMGLRSKGESSEEIAGVAEALRGAMVTVALPNPDQLVDTCGTGGGSVATLNISTAAAFVVAGAGVPVAKHGNRSYTTRSGSADLLEALGVDIVVPPERVPAVLATAGLVFLFAQHYHPAMRHVGPVRRQLGVPTIMNLVGPLANPAGVRRQVVGVADPRHAPGVADALRRLGAIHALVVHGLVGMDEISPLGDTAVWEIRDGRVTEWRLTPDPTLRADHLEDLRAGSARENAERVERLLRTGDGGGERAAVVLNAAAALYVSGAGGSFADAVERARRTLASGDAAAALDRLRAAAPALNTSG